MYIDRVFRTVKIILNTDGRGNFRPSEFNDVLYSVINEIYEELILEVNRYINRQNRGLISSGLENIAERTREKILFYLQSSAVSIATGVYPLPADLRYLDLAETDAGKEIEICKNNREFKTISNLIDTAPSVSYPVGLIANGSLKVAPASYVADVTFNYLRTPAIPKWTYQIISGVEVFNPSDGLFSDIDMHISCEDDIIARVASRFGVNLKEQDVQQVLGREQNEEFQKENTV